ncbi:MAG: hypothetical protein IAB16_07205 [Firmicutes bacterium]|uniref:Ribbon-helix-helix protein CopG domain-containing protein n=1 Tax=Candidatus Stercoripulliclostridium pullicola TaxID=2840953 RepID=A0A940DHZ9_9FIRM|nr:hypothetical protein [Candidatus Stercoripulliclostridium pullicola]
MQKSLYSLILMDDVVREIDAIARKQNTNRSNLINQILAEYVSMVTPEQRIYNIFNCIDNLLGHNAFDSYIEPNESTMSLKSSLNYRYRPTIRYLVELYRTGENASGELKIIFRTQSQELLFRLAEFFELWTKMEKIYLKDYSAQTINYSFENGKFTRTFAMPRDRIYDNEETARAISDYIRMFDDIVKGYLTGAYMSFAEMENRYLQYLNGSVVI